MTVKLTKYNVEKNIPIPSKKIPWTEFPFLEMEVGDSFFVPKIRYNHISILQTRSFLYGRIKEFKVDNNDYLCHFITHIDRDKKGVRCWRVE